MTMMPSPLIGEAHAFLLTNKLVGRIWYCIQFKPHWRESTFSIFSRGCKQPKSVHKIFTMQS